MSIIFTNSLVTDIHSLRLALPPRLPLAVQGHDHHRNGMVLKLHMLHVARHHQCHLALLMRRSMPRTTLDDSWSVSFLSVVFQLKVLNFDISLETHRRPPDRTRSNLFSHANRCNNPFCLQIGRVCEIRDILGQ